MNKHIAGTLRTTLSLSLVAAVVIVAMVVGNLATPKVKAWLEPAQGEPWMRGEAEQYKGATDGNWGEIVHKYEGWSCEVHRWRTRGTYYLGHVGNQCGALMEDPDQ